MTDVNISVAKRRRISDTANNIHRTCLVLTNCNFYNNNSKLPIGYSTATATPRVYQ